MIKAIETSYNGYRFRSRLEARWAVFFDALDIEYRYEPEGFDLDGIWYLPDFFLPQQNCWIEIKAGLPTGEEREKAIRLCIASQQPVALFGGDIWLDTKDTRFGFYPLANISREDLVNSFIQQPPPKEAKVYWLSSSECFTFDGRKKPYGYDLEREYAWSTAYYVQCNCGAVGIEMPTGVYPCPESCKGKMSPKTEKLKEAYTVARQARFERGGGR